MNGPVSEFSTTSTPCPPVASSTASANPDEREFEHMRDAELTEEVALLVAARGRKNLGTGMLGEANCGQPDAAGSGVDEDSLARGEARDLVQAVVRGQEGERQPSGIGECEPRRLGQDEAAIERDEGRESADRDRDHLVADRKPVDPIADRGRRSRCIRRRAAPGRRAWRARSSRRGS